MFWQSANRHLFSVQYVSKHFVAPAFCVFVVSVLEPAEQVVAGSISSYGMFSFRDPAMIDTVLLQS